MGTESAERVAGHGEFMRVREDRLGQSGVVGTVCECVREAEGSDPGPH